ncbi:MAG: ribonuclease R [Thermoanaerobaculia bacterium]|nr:ribonuclease R [Thermoanaerobaculia bacterium]
MSKKKKKGGKKLTAKNLQIELLKFLLTQPKKQFTPRQLADLLKIENNKDSVEHALLQLELAGSVKTYKENKFGIALERLTVAQKQEQKPEPAATTRKITPSTNSSKKSTAGQKKMIEGRVDMTRSGAAYIVSDSLDSDVYIAPRYLNGALNGDTVRVLLFPGAPRHRRGQPPRKPEGEVLEVIKRANEFFIGTLRKSRKYALFLPDNPNMPVDIYVPLEACGDARDGEKVVVRVTDWQEGKGRVPIGKVTQTLGEAGGNDFEMKKILINAGFELMHSEEALAEADRIPETVSPQEIGRRRDFRDVLTFTIDPEDAKDFDDALSIRTLENGNLEIGVHIADVTHYLKPDTPMDAEAFRRSTSVYLVDRVNPMLPEKLSNNLCSLVPYEDRLTFSAVFVFDRQDKIVSRWFGKTVIHSDKRFSYEEAQTILDGKPAESLLQLTIFPELDSALKTLDKLAKKMRRERERNGAIGFDTEEVRFRLAEDGTPLEAYVKERKNTHLLIEDFMLLANKEVAFFIENKAAAQQEIPFVYRVHDLPDLEKVAEFARFAAAMGHFMKVDTPKHIAQSYNALMRAAQKDDRLKVLEPLAIRTMAKAVYSSNNIGHYGLGFSHYAHFTSPIRRYADVLAHRLLERNLDGRTYRMDKSKLEEQCKHISNQEKKAADAERESVKYKQAELLRRHLGEEFEGYVSGIIDRGFFVELPGSLAEGLVEFKYLDDTYIMEEGNLRVKGRRYGRVIKMGDRVRVRITGVDLQKRQIEMELVE